MTDMMNEGDQGFMSWSFLLGHKYGGSRKGKSQTPKMIGTKATDLKDTC